MGRKADNSQKLQHLLQTHEQVTLPQAMQLLAISEATARRLFITMEQEQKCIRILGGIRRISAAPPVPYSFSDASGKRVVEKNRIGRYAATLVNSGNRIFFDSGTTVRECGFAVAERLAAGDLKDIVAVTNSLACDPALARACEVILTGGTIRQQRLDLVGTTALENLERFHFNKAFLGTDAVNTQLQLMTTDHETAAMAQKVISQSDEVYILCDSSKLDLSSFAVFASLNNEKLTLITDSGASSPFVSECRRRHVKLLMPPL